MSHLILLKWLQDPISASILISTVTLLSWLLLKLLRACKQPPVHSIHTSDPLRAHIWEKTKYLDKPTYCNVCEDLCIAGTQCQSCGSRLCTLSSCLTQGQNTHHCKPISLPSFATSRHFFVKGNLPLSSSCVVCQTPCGAQPELSDFSCVWCGRTYHEDCLGEKERISPCNLGPHRESIVPPNCVKLNKKGWKGRQRCVDQCVCIQPVCCVCHCVCIQPFEIPIICLCVNIYCHVVHVLRVILYSNAFMGFICRLVVEAISPPLLASHWRPLVVLANPKSGGKDGEMILSVFRRLLNPIQVGVSVFIPT